MHGQKHTVMEIMGGLLPPDERQAFINYTADVSSEDFFRLLATYFTDEQIRDGLLGYANETLLNLETETGIKVDAILGIYGVKFNYGNLNEEMGI